MEVKRQIDDALNVRAGRLGKTGYEGRESAPRNGSFAGLVAIDSVNRQFYQSNLVILGVVK